MGTVTRIDIADFLNVGGTAEKYVLMGTGFNTLDESPNAQKSEGTYINQKSKTTSIKGYQPTFAFDTDLIAAEEAVMALYDIGRNHETGEDAELDYVRVELFRPAGEQANAFMARKFRVAVEVASFAGAGGETVKVTGNLNSVGDFVDGTFDTTTKTFTPTA